MDIRKIDYKWTILGTAFFILLVGSGARNSFGVFFAPMQADFGTGRGPLSLAVAIGSLVGALCQPLAGKLADSLGAKLALAVGTMVMGLGLVGLGFAQDLISVYILFGVVLGVGFSLAGLIPNTALVTRWFVEHKGMALSIAVSGFNVGQVLLIPLAAQLIEAVGWRMTYIIMGIACIVLLLPVILLFVRSSPAAERSHRTGGKASPAPGEFTTVRQAMRTGSFWKLILSFSVCGSTLGMAQTHLIPFGLDKGIPATTAANIFALIGLVGIAASIVVSSISDKIGRKNPLAGLYLTRSVALLLLVVIAGPIAFPIGVLTTGLSRGTAPLTSALTGDLFGRLSIGTIFGLIFLSHETTAAIGSYLGGVAFDLTGSYESVFLIGAFVAVIGALAAFSISEKRPQSGEAIAKGIKQPATSGEGLTS